MTPPLLLSSRPIVIGEVAQAHDGSLGLAHAFVDAIADAGADAVKFQTHIAAAESRTDEPWRVRFSYEDESRYDYWRRMEFTEEQWAGLRRHADERGIAFLSSPFSIEAVELLERVGVAAWKIASGEVTNVPLLERVAGSGRPVLLSTGMSRMDEIEDNVALLRAAGAREIVAMQCTSSYPTPPEDVGLNVLDDLRERCDCPVGLSDHSGTIFPSLGAVTLGAQVVEVHVTLSREMFGPDVPASITTTELRQLVAGVDFLHRARTTPVEKAAMAERLSDTRATFTKSVVARHTLPAGHVLRDEDLALKKPGGGLPPAALAGLVGSRLRVALEPDALLALDDVEQIQ